MIDENIKPLVELLNSCRHKTIGSCGGHKNPSKFQQKYGRWFISLYFNDKNDYIKLKEICIKNKIKLYFEHGTLYEWIALRGSCSIIKQFMSDIKNALYSSPTNY